MSIRKRFAAIAASALLLVPVLAGCSFGKDAASAVAAAKDWPATVNGVTISSEPKGVAVVSANLADVVLSLGYETQLKSKTEDCTQEDLSTLPNVPSDQVDKIKAEGATLLLTDQKLSDSLQSAYQQAGISVVVIPAAQNRSGLTTLYQAVGTAMRGATTGAEKGKKAAESVFITIDDVTRMIPKSNVVKTGVYLYDTNGSVATGDMMAGTLLEAAGITNIAKDNTGGKLDLDAIKRSNPQYIFCPTGLKAKLAAADGYKDLDAVKNNQVFEMDPNLMELQGEGMLDAVTYMAGIAYPELLKTTSSSTSSSASGTSTGATIPNSTIPAGTTLKADDQNDNVLAMQNRLKELGFMFMNPTGLYGDGTTQAVKDFQLQNGIDTTGIADPNTLEKIFSKDAIHADGSTDAENSTSSDASRASSTPSDDAGDPNQ